jgi:hypothetical protein
MALKRYAEKAPGRTLTLIWVSMVLTLAKQVYDRTYYPKLLSSGLSRMLDILYSKFWAATIDDQHISHKSG